MVARTRHERRQIRLSSDGRCRPQHQHRDKGTKHDQDISNRDRRWRRRWSNSGSGPAPAGHRSQRIRTSAGVGRNRRRGSTLGQFNPGAAPNSACSTRSQQSRPSQANLSTGIGGTAAALRRIRCMRTRVTSAFAVHPTTGIHRADLQRILSAALGGAGLHLDHRLTEIRDLGGDHRESGGQAATAVSGNELLAG